MIYTLIYVCTGTCTYMYIASGVDVYGLSASSLLHVHVSVHEVYKLCITYAL